VDSSWILARYRTVSRVTLLAMKCRPWRRTLAVVEFVGATVVQLSTAVLDEARYVTRRLDEWAPLPGDDVERLAALEARSR
jgi:hypothetical protein